MTSLVFYPENCGRSVRLNSYRKFLFPTDNSYSALNYKQVHMPNLRGSRLPDKKHVFYVCIHHEPKIIPWTGWGKTQVELLNYWINVNENSWGWKRRREKKLRGYIKEKGEGKEQKKRKKKRKLVKEILFVRVGLLFLNWELEKAIAMHLISQLSTLVFFLFFNIFIGVYLLYNGVSVSAV